MNVMRLIPCMIAMAMQRVRRHLDPISVLVMEDSVVLVQFAKVSEICRNNPAKNNQLVSMYRRNHD
jgi:hypothetical protein